MAGSQRSRDEEVGRFEVWWDGGGSGFERGSMSRVPQEDLWGENHPQRDQKQVQHSGQTFDSVVAETRTLCSPLMFSYSTILCFSSQRSCSCHDISRQC